MDKSPENTLTPQDIKRYNLLVWKVVGGCFAFFVLVMLLTWWGAFGRLPSLRDLENPKSNQASQVLSSDKVVLGTYFIENRSNVNFKDISPNVINALIATEDKRFYDHSGIDYRRSFTIFLLNIFGSREGGSTITQQLAKNQFSNEKAAHSFLRRLPQKLKELITAVRIERRYTKQEIITMYLNSVSFGAYSTYGIKSAARAYFNTTPNQLEPEQAALLVGMLKGTGYYSPLRYPDRALARRNLVLKRMAEAGYLTTGQVDEFKQRPLGLNVNKGDHKDGLATYFRDVLKRDIQQIFEDKSINNNGVPYDLDRDGLKIYTTINATMQGYAEDAQKEYMRTLQTQFNQHWAGVSRWKTIPNFKLLLDQGMRRSDRYKMLRIEGKSDREIKTDFNTPAKMNLFTWHGNIDTTMKPIDSIVYCKMLLRNSLMSMYPTTGYIKAWVGGINFEHFKYDQVKQGSRQVGSTAKSFVYTVAINNGFSPCMVIPNVPITFPGDGTTPDYTPESNDTRPGELTLRQALGWSQNWITADLLKQVGVPAFVEITKKMGVHSKSLIAVPSMFLGSFDATVFDMTGAYAAFANSGIWTEPTYLLRIEDKNGNVLYENKPKVAQVLNEQTAYVMTYMLKGVIEDGTGSRLRFKYGLTNPIGGKTGTTQNNSDGWFLGITPQLVTGVWTGCEDRDIHFRSTALGEGANTALPIFALYMKKVYANPHLDIKKNIDFAKPKAPLTITLDCNAYKQQQ